MKNAIKWFGIIALVAVIGFSMVACGGDDDGDNNNNNNNNSTPTVSTVTVSGGASSVEKGASTPAFTASIGGDNNPAQTVTWSVDSPKHASTTISSSGVLSVNAAETNSPLTVRATSTVDTTKSGTATVAVITPIVPQEVLVGTWWKHQEPSFGDLEFKADGALSHTNRISVGPVGGGSGATAYTATADTITIAEWDGSGDKTAKYSISLSADGYAYEMVITNSEITSFPNATYMRWVD